MKWLGIAFILLTSANDFSFGFGGVRVSRAREQWINQVYIKASNAEAGDFFAHSVAINGDTLVVGSYLEDSSQTTITNGPTSASDAGANGSGAVYVYRKSGTTWIQEAYIKAPNAEGSDSFGYRIAISGDTLAVGAHREDSADTTITNGTTASMVNGSNESGAVYVFRRTGTTWAQEAYIKASNNTADDQFGAAIGINGDTIVVGALNEDSNQSGITNGTGSSIDVSALNSGAAYVYKRTGTTWAQEAYLKASNSGAGDLFGHRVDISGDTIVVSAHKESSIQNTITNGAGTPVDNDASESGAAYVFRRTGTTWAQEAYLKASNSGAGDWFSYGAVSIDGDTIVVGAQNEDSASMQIINGPTASPDNSAEQAGAAYVFRRSGTTWTQEAYLKAANTDAGDRYGFSVAISGDIIVVGAYQEDSNEIKNFAGTTASSNNDLLESGAAYIYRRLGSNWVQRSYLKAPNSLTTNYFGFSVATDGAYVLLGSYRDDSAQTTITHGAATDTGATDSGAAFLLKINR